VTRLAASSLALVCALSPGWPSASRADSARGQRAFQRCYACHSLRAGEHDLPGPSLRGIIGRRAGTLPGFEFSVGMIEAGRSRKLVWTRETLDAFLVDPERMVPGTTMGGPGLPDAEDRRDVIDYLEQSARGGRAAPGRSR
jgi:cytochrome c